MDKSDVLLGIIDDRCRKALKEANIPSKIVGTVVKVDSKNKKIDVKIAGYDTVFTLLNKSGEILSEGDNVFVESVKDNLTNGYISERFGEARWIESMVEDTGWQTITLNSKFHAYGNASEQPTNTPQYRKVGKTVYIRGAIAPYENQTSDGSGVVFANLPSDCRPSKNVFILCQGTGTKIWMLTIYTDGDLMISRYRDGASWNTIYADHWFPFNATFLVD